MHATLGLFRPMVRLTLFTRSNCGLCDTAKANISEYLKLQQQQQQKQQQQQQHKGTEYSEVDIMAPENQNWRQIYDFDVPVLHIDRNLKPNEITTIYSAKKKLFHRFTTEEVRDAVDVVGKDEGEEEVEGKS